MFASSTWLKELGSAEKQTSPLPTINVDFYETLTDCLFNVQNIEQDPDNTTITRFKISTNVPSFRSPFVS